MDPEPAYVVADLGGTTLRTARFSPATGELSATDRIGVDGLARAPRASVEVLQQRVVGQLTGALARFLDSPAGRGVTAVGLAFAGPVTSEGAVTGAPTVWGEGGAPLRLGAVLEGKLGLPVLIANDMSAAAYRYADGPGREDFCLITVSSGIGNKVFRGGEILIDRDGHGGELGHWRVDFAPDAPLCDCGGRGHLGAVASGRGMRAAARRAAEKSPDAYRSSVLARLAGPDPEDISNENLAAAIRQGDPFAADVLAGGLRPLASAIGSVFASIGIRRYIIIGGFALAVGEPYLEALRDEVAAVGCFGLSAREAREMITLGRPDDDHGLIGMGRMLDARLGPQAGENVPCVS
ncbi:ROK family protein [Streptomyces griseus]|uniref:ROK family protein n=1 Tax=Streptomyces sp. CMC78 TaxID=3231512 RepID=A0AB33KCW3_9ACTN|nr:ROK family protein [Streptomyces sp. ID01-9D]MDX5573772.1 ROK family protein [Streptomyces sp. ID01-9D]WSV23715.1 ROK family protein [Streptomyces fimicarius]WTC87379.1 ROK family protein [Streptomyces griseus]WTD69998.1 ROK family protein [Streptomyces griseus]